MAPPCVDRFRGRIAMLGLALPDIYSMDTFCELSESHDHERLSSCMAASLASVSCSNVKVM